MPKIRIRNRIPPWIIYNTSNLYRVIFIQTPTWIMALITSIPYFVRWILQTCGMHGTVRKYTALQPIDVELRHFKNKGKMNDEMKKTLWVLSSIAITVCKWHWRDTARPAKHGWKSFLTLTSIPTHIRDFKNLKGTWHHMLACSRQLQGVFGLLKPLLHVQIWAWNVAVNSEHGVRCIGWSPLITYRSILGWSLYKNGPVFTIIPRDGHSNKTSQEMFCYLTGRFTKSKPNKYNWTKQWNKKISWTKIYQTKSQLITWTKKIMPHM